VSIKKSSTGAINTQRLGVISITRKEITERKERGLTNGAGTLRLKDSATNPRIQGSGKLPPKVVEHSHKRERNGKGKEKVYAARPKMTYHSGGGWKKKKERSKESEETQRVGVIGILLGVGEK